MRMSRPSTPELEWEERYKAANQRASDFHDRLQEAQQRIAELEARNETALNTAIEMLSGGLCEKHSAHVKSISFSEFVEWDNAQGCKACLKLENEAQEQRIAELEAEKAHYEALLAGER